jgi:lysophospholipase L1-like esterase
VIAGFLRSRALRTTVLASVSLSLVGSTCAATRGPPPVALRIALLGDSVLSDMARDIKAIGFGGHPDTADWTIAAQTGAGWGAGEDKTGQWPLGVVQGTWAAEQVHALGQSHPNALVIELGTNDALRAAFADATSDAPTLAARRAGTDHNIGDVVAQAAALTSCVVLVTATAYPTPLFAGGTLYAKEAIRVSDRLRGQAKRTAHHATLVADWSAESAAHHLGDGSPGNWFATSDEIHPNFAGEQSLAALIASTAAKCPRSR